MNGVDEGLKVNLHQLLRAMIEKGASDMHITTGSPPLLRIDGAIVRREVRKPGIVRIRWRGAARRVRVVALDAAGNSSGPVVRVADPAQ